MLMISSNENVSVDTNSSYPIVQEALDTLRTSPINYIPSEAWKTLTPAELEVLRNEIMEEISTNDAVNWMSALIIASMSAEDLADRKADWSEGEACNG